MTLGGNRFLLVYGSETGQAKAICEEIAEKSPEHSLQADLHCLSFTEKKFWLEREPCVVIVVSTTGDGENPETAGKFWRRLKKKTLGSNHMSHVNYALLGLGDSNYSNFCNYGQCLHKRLQELGAKTFHPPGWADDATGLEQVADPWMDGLWIALKQQLGLSPDASDTTDGLETVNPLRRPVGASAANIVSNATLENDANINKLNSFQSSNDNLSSDSSEIMHEKSQNSSTRDTEVLVNDMTQELTPQTLNSTAKVNSNVKEEKLSIENPEKNKGDSIKCSNCTDIQLSSDPSEKCGVTKTEDESCSQQAQSLVFSLPPLSESSLNLPALPPSFLEINFHPAETVDVSRIPLQNGCPFPTCSSGVTMASVTMATRLTRSDAVKKTLKIEMDISDCGWSYEPGDSFSIVCPNSAQEVTSLLKRLGHADSADTTYRLSIAEATKKRNPSVPPHIPVTGTLRHTLATCCDVRSAPKKAFLRALLEYSSDEREKRRLQELASRQGAPHYTKYIRETSVTLLHILYNFPSCNPPIEVILEHLPRLQPRPYSAASCLSTHPDTAHFVFNVIEIPEGDGRLGNSKGVCTGWLNEVTGKLQTSSEGQESSQDQDTISDLESLSLNPVKIPVYLRSNQHFRPPPDPLSTPVIMIGPGTGLAPFIGFLQQRFDLLSCADTSSPAAPWWLFFGCRHEQRDYLFREELESFASNGTLSKLLVSFSRDPPPPEGAVKYVQDNLRHHAADVAELMHNPATRVYVCGDAKNMAKDVTRAFVDIFQQAWGLEQKAAEGEIMQMRLQKRYLEDVWT